MLSSITTKVSLPLRMQPYVTSYTWVAKSFLEVPSAINVRSLMSFRAIFSTRTLRLRIVPSTSSESAPSADRRLISSLRPLSRSLFSSSTIPRKATSAVFGMKENTVDSKLPPTILISSAAILAPSFLRSRYMSASLPREKYMRSNEHLLFSRCGSIRRIV